MPVARIYDRYALYIKLQILDTSKPVEKTELQKKSYIRQEITSSRLQSSKQYLDELNNF